MLEEIYVYFDMPEPAYGIQLVYNDTEYPELITAVRDGDAVLMARRVPPKRFCAGPTESHSLGDGGASRGRGSAVWCREYSAPGFQQGGSGLEVGRK